MQIPPTHSQDEIIIEYYKKTKRIYIVSNKENSLQLIKRSLLPQVLVTHFFKSNLLYEMGHYFLDRPYAGYV